MQEQNQTSLDRFFNTARAFLKARPAISVVLAAAILLCAIGITYSFGRDDDPSGSPQASPNSTVAAIRNFWSIYHGNNYAAIPQAQNQLQRAIQFDPNNPTLYALLGATHFWHVGESSRDPKPDMTILQQDMPTAASLFRKALSLDYYAPHLTGYVNDDHLPGYLGITTVHTGQEFRDPNLIAKGDAMLDFAVYQFPEFNTFNRWAAHNSDHKDTATYKEALDSLWQGIDDCIGGAIDRNNPDIKPYLDLVTSVGRKKACWWEGDVAPYGFEGYLLNLGNGLVKAGQIDAARVIFADAKYAANYSTWPYRDVLETIAASDLNARAALYADADPSNDPLLSVPNRSCVYCHATVPEPASH
jgi:hypothetical protein